MNEDAIRSEYSKLPPIPEAPGERTWYQRVNTVERFLDRGREVADYFRMIERDATRQWVERTFRIEAPELFDLLMRAFPAR